MLNYQIVPRSDLTGTSSFMQSLRISIIFNSIKNCITLPFACTLSSRSSKKKTLFLKVKSRKLMYQYCLLRKTFKTIIKFKTRWNNRKIASPNPKGLGEQIKWYKEFLDVISQNATRHMLQKVRCSNTFDSNTKNIQLIIVAQSGSVNIKDSRRNRNQPPKMAIRIYKIHPNHNLLQ